MRIPEIACEMITLCLEVASLFLNQFSFCVQALFCFALVFLVDRLG